MVNATHLVTRLKRESVKSCYNTFEELIWHVLFIWLRLASYMIGVTPTLASSICLIFFLFSPFYWAGFVAQRERAQQDSKVPYKVPHVTHPPFTYERQPQHRDYPTLIRIVRGFFNVPQNYQHSRNCETGPPVYRPYPRRLESLTICR